MPEASVIPPPAAPAPAAPAPAPAPSPEPAAPAPAAAPPPAAPAPPAPENPFAELEAKVKAYDKPPEVTKGKEPVTKPTEPAKPAEPAAPAKPAEPQRGPKELRAELERARQESAAASASLQTLQQKIREYELRGKDTEALVARQTTLEKELSEARAEVRAIKQEASPEFIKEYKKPFDDAAAYAKHVIEQFNVLDEDGTPTRQAKFEDLQQLFAMPINKASAVSRTMFGDDSQTVISHLNELHRLDYNYQNALRDERVNADKRAKDEQGKQVAAREQMDKTYFQVNKDLSESVEEYRDVPDDKEAAEMRTKGYAIFDGAPDSIEKAIVKKAHVRQMVAAFFPMKLQLTRLRQEVAELKGKLGHEKESDPGRVKHPGGAPAPAADPNETWEQSARKALL